MASRWLAQMMLGAADEEQLNLGRGECHELREDGPEQHHHLFFPDLFQWLWEDVTSPNLG